MFEKCFINEPQYDKPNKCPVSPAETQIRLRPVWSAQCVAKNPRFLHADSEDWLDWADAQADLKSSLGAYVILLVLSNIIVDTNLT